MTDSRRDFRPGDIVRMSSGRTTYQVARLVRPRVADLLPASGRPDASHRCLYQVEFARLVLVQAAPTPKIVD